MPNKPGRPSKPASMKRQQLHISLYQEDIDKLNQLTDNVSGFIRQAINRAWVEKHGIRKVFLVEMPEHVSLELEKVNVSEVPASETEALPKTVVDHIVRKLIPG